MSRKSKDLDKKMLRIGAAILNKKGAAALSIREVAKKANVNLGMFAYYFNGKDDFIATILDETYKPFLTKLSKSKNHLDGLNDVLFEMAVFSRDQQQLILLLIGDVLAGEKNVIKFLQKNFTNHFLVLNEVLTSHFKRCGYNKKFQEPAFRYLISAVGLPNLITGLKVRIQSEAKIAADSDEQLRRRVHAAVNGLKFICKE